MLECAVRTGPDLRWPRGRIAAEPRRAAKADPAKGATIATAVCAACHTSDGSRGSAANPIMQGQHPDYLVKQLADFKAGKRDNADHEGDRVAR